VRQDGESDPLPVLHQRLLDGDPLAAEEMTRFLLGPMAEETQRRFPRVDEQLINDAVVEALLEYVSNPASVGNASDLRAHLRTAAWRNAANLHRSSRRRQVRDQVWITGGTGSTVEDAEALGRLIEAEDETERRKQIAELNDILPDERDRAVLRLRLDGERKIEAFSVVLGIAHLPKNEQRRIVKQTKDRIDKVIRRRRGRDR
jgi:DNA-directed RNA polymerase specialized sigma24 family protein